MFSAKIDDVSWQHGQKHILHLAYVDALQTDLGNIKMYRQKY